MQAEAAHVHRWKLLVTVASGLLLITLDNSVLYTALPTLSQELHATEQQALWIINAYPLVMAGLLLGAGTLGDRVGHRRMFLVGLGIFGCASVGAAFSPSANLLIAARAVLAIGAAAMMPATLALIRIAFTDQRERNFAVAVWGSLSIVGSALGPIVGGVLLNHFWWGSVFLINVPVVLVAVLAAIAYAPHEEPDRSMSWDMLSSILALFALSGLVFAIKSIAHTPPSWGEAALSAGVAAVAGAAFVRRQKRLPHPLLDFAIFSNKAFASGTLAAGAAMFVIGGLQLLTTQRFQMIAGFSPIEAGLLVSAVAVGCLPSALIGGAILHRTGLRPLIAGGLFVAAAGIALATLSFRMGEGVALFVSAFLLTGFGLGSVMSVASSAIIGNVPTERAGMASSVEEVSYEFGSLLAVAILGSLVAALFTNFASGIGAGGLDQAHGIADALAMANRAGDSQAVAALGRSYDRAYTIAIAVVGVITLAGALVTWHLLRDHRAGESSVATQH